MFRASLVQADALKLRRTVVLDRPLLRTAGEALLADVEQPPDAVDAAAMVPARAAGSASASRACPCSSHPTAALAQSVWTRATSSGRLLTAKHPITSATTRLSRA